MPQVWKNAMLVINGVDLSAHVSALSLAHEVESLDATRMGQSSRIQQGGLKTPGIDVTFFQAFACVDATLFALVGCQTSIEIRACNACSSEGNPVYEGTFMVQSYPPMGGGVGELLAASVRFEAAGLLRHCAQAS